MDAYGLRASELGSPAQRNGSWPVAAKIILLVFLGIVILTFDLWLAASRERSTPRGDDFFQFWAAGRAIVQGEDPYDPQTWRQTYKQKGRWRWQTDQPVFLYPLWTAFPFVPLATIPVSWAAFLWAVMSQLFLVLSGLLITRGLNWNRYQNWLLLLIPVLVTFEPLALTILFGQLGTLLLVFICGIAYMLSRGGYTWPASLWG